MSKLINYIKSPGGIIAVVAILLGLYFFLASQKYPMLVMIETPHDVLIEAPKNHSDLKITYKNEEIKDSVYISQFIIQNNGRAFVKNDGDDMVLEPISIVFDAEKTKVLDIKVLKVKHKVIDFRVDTSELDEGKIPLKWHILEKDDGVLFQIIYASSLKPKFELSGSIVGQRSFKNNKAVFTYSSSKDMLFKIIYALFSILLPIFFVWILIKAGIMPKIISDIKAKNWHVIKLVSVGFISTLVLFLIFIFQVIQPMPVLFN